MDNATQPVERLFCNHCLRKTRHEALASARQDEQEEYEGGWTLDWHNVYRVLECRGCGNITYHTQHWNSEDMDHERKW
jgi:hypothetical protein